MRQPLRYIWDFLSGDGEVTVARFSHPSFFAGSRWWLEYVFILVVCGSQILGQAATWNVMVQLNEFLEEMHGVTQPAKPWPVAATGTVTGISSLVTGRLGDLYGIKLMVILGFAWTTFWTLLTGLSYYYRHYERAFQFFVSCRAFTGIGIALFSPNIIAAIGRIYSPATRRKSVLFTLIGFMSPVGGFCGTFMNGVITTTTSSWGWSFYPLAIFSFILMVMAIIAIPYLEPIKIPGKHAMGPNIIGGTLGMGSLTLFCFVWDQAPIDGWDKAYIIVLLIVSVFMFIAFWIWESRFAHFPFVMKEIGHNYWLMSLLAALFFGWGTFGIVFIRFFFLTIDHRHYSPIAAGAGVTPAVVSGGVASLLSAVMTREKTAPYFFFVSMTCFLGSAILMATAPVNESYFRQSMATWILIPFGLDFSFPSVTLIVSDWLPPRLQGLAGSSVSFATGCGIAVNLAIAGEVQSALSVSSPLRGMRGALYYATGVAGMSCLVSFAYIIYHIRHPTKPCALREEEQKPDQIYYVPRNADSESALHESRTSASRNDTRSDARSEVSNISTPPQHENDSSMISEHKTTL